MFMKWETFIDQLQENWSDNFNKKSKSAASRLTWKSHARAFFLKYFTGGVSDFNDNNDPNAIRAKIYFDEGDRAKQDAREMRKAIKEQKALYQHLKNMKKMYPATPEDPNPAAVEIAREHLVNAILARHPEFIDAKNKNNARDRLKRAISVASIASKLATTHSKQVSTASQQENNAAVPSLLHSKSMPRLFDGKASVSRLTLPTIDDENKIATSPRSPSLSTAASRPDEDKMTPSYRLQPLSPACLSLERVASPSLSRLAPMERIAEDKATSQTQPVMMPSLSNSQAATTLSEKENNENAEARELQARTADIRQAIHQYLRTEPSTGYASPSSGYASVTSIAAKAAASPRVSRTERTPRINPTAIKMPTFYNVIGLNILNPFYWGAMIVNRIGAGLGAVGHGIATLINTAFGETRQNGIVANVCKTVLAGPFFAANCIAYTASKIFGAGGLRDTWRALTKKPDRRNSNVEEAITPRRRTLSSLRQEQKSNVEMSVLKKAPAKKVVYPATVGPIRVKNAVERLRAQSDRQLDALNLADAKSDVRLKQHVPVAKLQSADASEVGKTVVPGSVLEASPRRPVYHSRSMNSAKFFARNIPQLPPLPLPPLPSALTGSLKKSNQSARLKAQPNSVSEAAPSVSLGAVQLKA
jgi:hypothetical protein